jgi:hypothetical protein
VDGYITIRLAAANAVAAVALTGLWLWDRRHPRRHP